MIRNPEIKQGGYPGIRIYLPESEPEHVSFRFAGH